MKRRILIIVLTILSIILFICNTYKIKPIIFSVEFTEKYSSSIILRRKFRKCSANIIVNYPGSNEIIINDLLQSDYEKLDKTYVKNKIINNSCNNVYKKYANNKINFYLNGKKNITVEALSEYVDEKYIINKHKKNVSLISNIDTKKLGKEYIVYKLDEGLYSKYLVREIDVIDTIKPIVELKGKANITIYLNNDYNEPGYTATDNYDGDITDNVITRGSVDNSKAGKYELVYKVKDSSGNESDIKRTVQVKEEIIKPVVKNVSLVSTSDTTSNLTYINGILVVNKTYSLPKDYNPGVNSLAYSALIRMQNDAKSLGYDLRLVSGFRSYKTQVSVYNNYVNKYGVDVADTFSARPGHSEHQTGLAFDVGNISDSFGDTPSGIWLHDNCHLYGFIIRYPKGKQSITGYKYEPWHIRYLGVDVATNVKNSGLTLEEYLGI